MEPTSDRSSSLGRRAFVAAALGAAASVPLGVGWADAPAHARDPLPVPRPTDFISWREIPLPGIRPVVAALMADPSGAIWFSDATSDSLVRIVPETGATTKFDTAASTNSMVMAPDGTVWFAATPGVGALDPATGALAWYALPTPYPKLAAGADGRIWFTDAAHSGIGSIDRSGTIATYTSGGATEVSLITVAVDGKVWFTRGGNELGVFDPGSGVFRVRTTGPTELTGLTSVPSGGVWAGGPSRLMKFDDDANMLTSIPMRTASGVGGTPKILVPGVHAELFFRATDLGIGRVNGDDTITFMMPPFEKSAPMGLAVTPAGSVWFAHRFRETLGYF